MGDVAREFRKGLPNSTKEEMNKIAEYAAAGSQMARHALGELMQPFVIGYVRTIRGDYTRDQRNEITQAAWLGVAEALDRWDAANDVKFNTYAHFWIKGEVNKWLAQNSGVLSLPRTAWVDAGKVEERLRDELGDSVLPHEIPDDTLATIELTGAASPTRHFKSAGAAFRARQAPFYPDLTNPEWEPSAAESAEAIFFEESHDQDDEALDVLALCSAHILNGNRSLAEDTANYFVHTHNLPDTVAENLLALAEAQ